MIRKNLEYPLDFTLDNKIYDDDDDSQDNNDKSSTDHHQLAFRYKPRTRNMYTTGCMTVYDLRRYEHRATNFRWRTKKHMLHFKEAKALCAGIVNPEYILDIGSYSHSRYYQRSECLYKHATHCYIAFCPHNVNRNKARVLASCHPACATSLPALETAIHNAIVVKQFEMHHDQIAALECVSPSALDLKRMRRLPSSTTAFRLAWFCTNDADDDNTMRLDNPNPKQLTDAIHIGAVHIYLVLVCCDNDDRLLHAFKLCRVTERTNNTVDMMVDTNHECACHNMSQMSFKKFRKEYKIDKKRTKHMRICRDIAVFDRRR